MKKQHAYQQQQNNLETIFLQHAWDIIHDQCIKADNEEAACFGIQPEQKKKAFFYYMQSYT
jgi:hypothetical protein